ncbi:uncharacterized protein LOC142642214 [Castanea sativa]|uniref:uncharacterized protein LOC142642214 n=1 Tax=Castanea sativa TaxID=21020 RepID=UPI003F653738
MLTRVQDVFTTKELKVFSGVPSNKVVGRHIHKLVQVFGKTIHITSEYLSHEMKATSVGSWVVASEAKNSKLRKDFIAIMDEANTSKEKAKVLSEDLRAERQLTLEKDEQLLAAKEKIKTVVAKSVEAFQQAEEYKTILFSWYYKAFKLLRWVLIKHPTGVDQENLDLEEVDKEMIADEAS